MSFIEESNESIQKKLNELERRIEEIDNSFDEDEFESNYYEFDPESEAAARRDIEDEAGEFEEVGSNEFEKKISSDDFNRNLEIANFLFPNYEKENDRKILNRKQHEEILGKVSLNELKIRNFIRKKLLETFMFEEDENIEEERIANPDSKHNIDNLENFIGSHIYGEDLGGLGKMYVAYSYGEQFPVYLNYKGKWYHNNDSYQLEDGEVNNATEKHKVDMKPSSQTKAVSLRGMQKMITSFKKKNNIGDNNHKDVEPGEKN